MRLLLHAVNGCVPYLSPSVLQANFPPSDLLWLGMAVRDVSVVADYNTAGTGRQKKKAQKASPSSDGKNGAKQRTARGFTFDSVPPDPWLLQYQRVTVPTFDLRIDDNNNHSLTSNKQPNQTKQAAHPKLQTSTSSDKHVSVWTPHGRQKLTPQLYSVAAKGLSSQTSVSLFDMDEPNISKNRGTKALERNKKWFSHLKEQQREEEQVPSRRVWYPLLMPPVNVRDISTFIRDALPRKEMNHQLDGIALIGKFENKQMMTQVLHAINREAVGVSDIAILATESLVEFLEIVSCYEDINVIGMDLPTRWAKQQMAFGIRFDTSVLKGSSAKKARTQRELDLTPPPLNRDGCMDLSDHVYARDTSPLVVGCSCLTCDRFSRAYIHHLVQAKELLAEILLFGHNLHHTLIMMKAFNESERMSALDFQRVILDQLLSLIHI